MQWYKMGTYAEIDTAKKKIVDARSTDLFFSTSNRWPIESLNFDVAFKSIYWVGIVHVITMIKTRSHCMYSA